MTQRCVVGSFVSSLAGIFPGPPLVGPTPSHLDKWCLIFFLINSHCHTSFFLSLVSSCSSDKVGKRQTEPKYLTHPLQRQKAMEGRVFHSPVMPSPGIFLHGLPRAQGSEHLLTLLSVKFCLYQKVRLVLPELFGSNPQSTYFKSDHLHHLGMFWPASDTLWLTQTKVYFSHVTGSPAVKQQLLFIRGLIMPRLGSQRLSTSFFHDCYLAFSSGCWGSRHLVHIQGWKKWGKR